MPCAGKVKSEALPNTNLVFRILGEMRQIAELHLNSGHLCRGTFHTPSRAVSSASSKIDVGVRDSGRCLERSKQAICKAGLKRNGQKKRDIVTIWEDSSEKVSVIAKQHDIAGAGTHAHMHAHAPLTSTRQV